MSTPRNVCFRPIADTAVNAHPPHVANHQTLETASSADAARRWVLRHRVDGHFEHVEYSYVDLSQDGQVEGYWKRSYTSGLFDTAEAARADALDTISWLPGQL